MGSAWFSRTFVNFWKYPQITEGGPNFLEGTNSADRLNYLVRSSAFPFQKFKEPKFFVIHCTSMSSSWFTSTFLNFLRFLKLKRGDLCSCWEPILENGWIIWSYLLISIPEIWGTQIPRYLLHFNGLQSINQYFSQFFEISSNFKGGT